MSDSDSSPLVKAGAKITPRQSGPAGVVRRRATNTQVANKPNSTRAAGAGGSSGTMLKLYSGDDAPGLRVDPFVVIILSLAFIASIFFLHISAKVIKSFSK